MVPKNDNPLKNLEYQHVDESRNEDIQHPRALACGQVEHSNQHGESTF